MGRNRTVKRHSLTSRWRLPLYRGKEKGISGERREEGDRTPISLVGRRSALVEAKIGVISVDLPIAFQHAIDNHLCAAHYRLSPNKPEKSSSFLRFGL
ncbi:hypothetical protein LWI29_020324 [Acer saccharum]|uniref:Uncharacterized protein n=1 Tax=Acer saccharum TaxID=4024 RepID=A0AA39STE9_ACESA|nr:hypothetical protein LWI29_020324 [Acer saccharum]